MSYFRDNFGGDKDLEKRYYEALQRAMEYVKEVNEDKKLKGCKEHFDTWLQRQNKRVERNIKWLKTQPHDVGRDKDNFEHFTEDEVKLAYRVWQVAWVLGQKNGRRQMQERSPLTDQEMKDLWIKCGEGKTFGRAIEQLHRIKK